MATNQHYTRGYSDGLHGRSRNPSDSYGADRDAYNHGYEDGVEEADLFGDDDSEVDEGK